MKQTLVDLWYRAIAFAKRYKTPILAVLIPLAIVTALVFLIWLDYISGWTGLGAYENPNYAEQPRFLWGKSVWDWLDLLLVPVVLAIGGLLFSRAERKAEREIADRRTKEDRRIAAQRTKEDRRIATGRIREATLQNYLDKMTELMLEHGLRSSEFDDEIRGIARARTLTALRSLDGARKGLLLRFLYESDLIGPETFIRLQGADLSEADLRGGHLSEIDLRGANPINASLRGADLRRVDLSNASLGPASPAEADLHGWKTTDGADLTEADLREAKVTEEQLAQARSLYGATMPDGTVHE